MTGRLIGLLATAAAMLAIGAAPASGAISDVETPTVSGPVPVTADSHPFAATDEDLDGYGYVEEEFKYSGDAYRYDRSGADDVTATRILDGGPSDDGRVPYTTRMIVRRPADAADFNGTVVVEWLNVTAGFELEANWYGDPEYLLANGYAYVGISAQRTGVSYLQNAFDPARYGDLDIPDGAPNPQGDADALSFEIFSAGIKALLDGGSGVDPLGPLAKPDTVIASGESQSGSRLAQYYNKIEPLHEIVDGFLLTVSTSSLRDDRPEKAIRVLSETENRTQRTEPDDASYRHWEVAGGSHLPRMAYDNFQGPVFRDTGGLDVECQRFPLSLVQWPLVVNSAYKHLEAWIDGGAPPPIAPRGEYADPSTLERDALGLAKGGIRLPEMDVPVRLNTGSNGPSSDPNAPPLSIFCILLGSSEDFSQSLLSRLYRDYGDYIDQVRPKAEEVAAQGFVLDQDVPRLIDMHKQVYTLRPAAPKRSGKARPSDRRFKLNWRGSRAPATTFRLQHSRDGGATWSGVPGAGRLTKHRFKFRGRGEKPGTWIYRVRSRTVIPENVVATETVVKTRYSKRSGKSRVTPARR